MVAMRDGSERTRKGGAPHKAGRVGTTRVSAPLRGDLSGATPVETPLGRFRDHLEWWSRLARCVCSGQNARRGVPILGPAGLRTGRARDPAPSRTHARGSLARGELGTVRHNLT